MREYCERMNIPLIENWNVYMAFILFRVAAILQGVYKRSLKGQESSSDAQKMGLLAETMAKAGWSFTQTKPGQSGAQNRRNYSTSTSHHPGFMPMSANALADDVQDLLATLQDFMKEHVYPNESVFEEHQKSEDCWKPHPLMEQLKSKAKTAGLWNLFIPVECDPSKVYGAGLTNVEYAFLCEEMGKSVYAPEMFNCSAPDTGNMEVLIKYGSQEQKEEWLQPLLDGRIRSCFAMTEPNVASSDATNIQAKIEQDGDFYIINGRKWWTSGALDPRCEIAVFMGKTDPSAAKHKQQSMVLVPFKTPGVEIIRHLSMFGYLDPP
ncbi:acyl- dehydrogenase family member 10-like isoform X1, partial [Paramuricea clavata]